MIDFQLNFTIAIYELAFDYVLVVDRSYLSVDIACECKTEPVFVSVVNQLLGPFEPLKVLWGAQIDALAELK